MNIIEWVIDGLLKEYSRYVRSTATSVGNNFGGGLKNLQRVKTMPHVVKLTAVFLVQGAPGVQEAESLIHHNCYLPPGYDKALDEGAMVFQLKAVKWMSSAVENEDSLKQIHLGRVEDLTDAVGESTEDQKVD